MTSDILEIMEGGRIQIEIESEEDQRAVMLRLSELYEKQSNVWRAEEIGGKRSSYILKILQGVRADDEAVQCAEREARVFIPDDYVLPLIRFKQWSRHTFLALFEDFCGEPLDQLLRQDRLTSIQKQRIFRQTLLGIADIHQSGLVHRDLWPANILVNLEQATVRLLDAGLGALKGPDPETGIWPGALPYIAPELLVPGGRADQRADIYSLGQILYELAHGHNFWHYKRWSSISQLIDYVRGDPTNTIIKKEDLRCDFFPGAAETIQGMTKIEPEQRLASVDQVLEGLGYLVVRSAMLVIKGKDTRNGKIDAMVPLDLKDGGECRLGRAEIAGADTRISRRDHVLFKREGEKFFVQDLGHRNGTFLGRKRLEPNHREALSHGDTLRIGDQLLRFVVMRRTQVRESR